MISSDFRSTRRSKMRNHHLLSRFLDLFAGAALLGFTGVMGCNVESSGVPAGACDPWAGDEPPKPPDFGDEGTPFLHNTDLSARGARDPFDILAQRQEEGPPLVRARMHSCRKLQIAALRQI